MKEDNNAGIDMEVFRQMAANGRNVALVQSMCTTAIACAYKRVNAPASMIPRIIESIVIQLVAELGSILTDDTDN